MPLRLLRGARGTGSRSRAPAVVPGRSAAGVTTARDVARGRERLALASCRN
jgi:hypothetical protein